MAQNFWEANHCSTGQEITCLIRTLKVRNRVHNSLPLDPDLTQLNPVHNLTDCFLKIPFNVIHPPTFSSPKCSSHFGYPDCTFVCIFAPAGHLDLIIEIKFAEQYKLWSSSLCNFLNPSLTFSLLDSHILLSTLYWNILNLCSSRRMCTKFHIHTKQQVE
jgi:hypothetical protein